MECKVNRSILKLATVGMLTTVLLGCSAAQTAMKKQELSVESKTSYSVVLEPMAPSKRVVYAKVRDLSGNSMRKPMQRNLENMFRSEGFVVTDDPEQANLMITASIVSAEKTDKAGADRYLTSGYKGGLEGGATLAAIGSVAGMDGRDTAGLALVGAAAGFLADTLVEDVYYTFVMDVQMRERPLDGDSIANTTKNSSVKGTADRNTRMSSTNNSSVTRGDNYNWIVYETRIVTTANKMNLKIEEAIPEVQLRTAQTLAEIML